MSTGKTQFQTGTITAGKSSNLLKAQDSWFWLTVIRVTSGPVVITGAEGNSIGMPIGSTPVVIPVSPGTEVYAYSTSDDEIGYAITPMPPGATESLMPLIQAIQRLLAPQTISPTTPIRRDLIDELNLIKRRG